VTVATVCQCLFDRKTQRVVSNESADIVRMFSMISGSFDEGMLARMEPLNARIYQDVNNGAYRAGFTSNQEAHLEAVCVSDLERPPSGQYLHRFAPLFCHLPKRIVPLHALTCVVCLCMCPSLVCPSLLCPSIVCPSVVCPG
jgi:hypothetical protein